MKLQISKTPLNDAIQDVMKAVPTKTSNPILTGIKIDADSHGVTLTATDSDITIRRFIAAEEGGLTIIDVHIPGSVVLPAKFFSEIVRRLPMEKVLLEVNDLFTTVLRSGKVELQLVGLDPEEFPSLPQIERNHSIEISSHLLKDMIRQTVFAIATNESTPVLTGVLWTVEDRKIKFTACDRHRLASRETDVPIDSDIRINPVVVSGRTLNELQKILPDQNEMVTIVFSDNQILFRFRSILFYSQVLDGTYPDTTKLIPRSFNTELVLERSLFEDAIERAYLLSRESKSNIVKLSMNENQSIEISSSSSEIGKVTEEIDAKEISGELLKISFNSKFMLDALKVIDNDWVHLGFTSAMHPIIMKPLEDATLMQLILPYRTMN
ncbi:MAG: polymerase subunit beta [Paenibacillaceae bacterium]|jgi:DNA polymerase-3 subunit beta|nr:polymerase subunit beta [Paenibacillaceae bacterium]